MQSIEVNMSGNDIPACEAPSPDSVAEYESRRCAVCGAKYPSFGFGPPMTRPGIVIWACFVHWKDVESQLAQWTKPGESEEVQGTLL